MTKRRRRGKRAGRSSRKPRLVSAKKALSPAASLRRVAETLAIAAVGGAALGLAGVPAGWLSGSIVAVAAASLAGRPLLMPALLMRAIFVLDRHLARRRGDPADAAWRAAYPLSIAVLVVAIALVGFAGARYLQIVHGWDKTSAYLAASPGAMSQVIVLAAEVGADLRAIAIVQTMRVVIIAVGLPTGLALARAGQRVGAAQRRRPVRPIATRRAGHPDRIIGRGGGDRTSRCAFPAGCCSARWWPRPSCTAAD